MACRPGRSGAKLIKVRWGRGEQAETDLNVNLRLEPPSHNQVPEKLLPAAGNVVEKNESKRSRTLNWSSAFFVARSKCV